jgi:DNA-binding NarL/FixJ family response regulator
VPVLTTFDEDDHVFEAIRAGAAGHLLEDVSQTDLREGIRVVAYCGTATGPGAAPAPRRRGRGPPATLRGGRRARDGR